MLQGPESRNMTEIIRIEYTPNPNALKFIVDQYLTFKSESKMFLSEVDAKGNTFVLALFAVENVEGIYLQDNFITITKETEADWDPIVGHVQDIIEIHEDIGVSSIYEGQRDESEQSETPKIQFDGKFKELEREEKLVWIDKLLDAEVRPGLASDGGGLEVDSINDHNVVSILYFGACGGCPSSTTGTLMFIESLLQERLCESITVLPLN